MPTATTKLPPDSAALRAATLSFAKKSLPVQSPPSTRPRPKSISTSSRSVSQRSELSLADLDRCPPRKTPSKDRENRPLLSPPSSALAANLAFSRSTPPSPTRENVNTMTSPESQKGSSAVLARRRLFQDGAKGYEDTMEVPVGPPPLHRISPENSRPGSPTKSPVDSNSLDDISSIKRIFESSGASSRPPPVLRSPKPLHPPNTSNPSMTAAVLATQLSSPPMSARSSRSGSPVYRDSASPTKRKPVPSRTAAPVVSPRSSQGPPVASRLASRSSRESLVSRNSTNYTASTAPTTTTALSASTALTAATLAHSSSPRATAPQPPPPRNGRVSTNPDTAPAPPPPRKTRSAAASTTSVITPRPPPSTFDSNISLPSLPSHRNTSALSAARLSHGASTLSLPLPRSTTGDSTSTSTIAASLAPSRTTTPGPRKPPQPTPPPPRRQPSPQKPLPPTLRPTRPRSLSPSPPRHALNKTLHHAAARDKKYQRTISTKAKKRYEGLWAANRGYLLPPTQSQSVCNIVVRELWKRSRLGNRVLGEIWTAVDRGEKGWLEREEFVVGTWLVDQALMGRKPPGRIQNAVFEGVAGGARVPVPPPPRRQGTL